MKKYDKTILTNPNLLITSMPPSMFRFYGSGIISFGEFQDGGHLGYRNETKLVILNFNVAPFQFNPTYVSGGAGGLNIMLS